MLHTGVRARQEKVPFATCEDEGTVDAEVKPLLGESLHPCRTSQDGPAQSSAACCAFHMHLCLVKVAVVVKV